MRNLRNISCVLMFLILTINSFAQLDSVFYQTSVGSVNSGAMQTTDNFFDEFIPPIAGEIFEMPPLPRNIPPGLEGEMPEIDESLIPETIYIEDTGMYENPSGGNGQTVLLNSFLGFNATNAVPPDPTMAAGPNHVIAMVNGFPSWFRIFDKQGNVLKTISAAAWWAPVSPDEYGDPQILYDHFAGRWFMLVMQVNDGNLTAGNLIAYSDDSDPLGIWYVYRLDTKLHGTVSSNTWGDYPQIGFDDEAIYIMTRCFTFGSNNLLYNKIRVIKKSELYASNGGPLTWRDFWNIGAPNNPASKPDGIHPTFCYTAGQGGYFFWAGYGGWNSYYLYRVLNPLSSSPTIKGKIIPASYGGSPNANQLGGGQIMSNGSACRVAPIVKDGKLYMTHSVQNPVFPANISIRYNIVNLSTYTIDESADLGAQNYYYIFPTIAVDQNGNLALTFSRSADTEYVGAFYSSKQVGDPPGLQPSVPFAEGKANYSQGNPSRWGDYMAIYLDPSNNYDVWMHTEYVAAQNSWATYIGRIRMEPFSGVYTYASPLSINFGDVEVGDASETFSTIISNYGDTDLIISAIPSSVGSFNLLTNVNVPYTLMPYDSLELEFNFTPTDTGVVAENFNFTSNDPAFNGFTFTGNGYKIFPVIEKTFYASSGVQNNGNILTIDKTSGVGSIVGPSSFSAVKSITIHPQTGVLYGLAAGTNSSEIIRINASLGDSYTLHTINIPTLASVAFDTAGTFYIVTLNGEFYTVDLTSGATNFVVDAVGTYSGITFHPETNELWATTRSLVLNKDAVFKVDLNTGDTTLVGNTGLNKLTNAIAFDENLNLFGIIGADSEIADFVSINTSNGEGTIIGSVGYKNISGLAYTDKSVSDVKNERQNIPLDYALRQNYPNPFNPATRINFVTPVASFVELKVYDILGREVAVLLNEEKPAGYYDIEFDAGGLPSGIYLYQLKAGSFTETKKMMLLK